MSKNTRTRLCSHTRNKHSVPFSSAFVVSHAGVVLLLLLVVLSVLDRARMTRVCNLFPSHKCIIHEVSQKVSIKKTARIKSEKRDAFKASCVFDDDTRAISNRR